MSLRAFLTVLLISAAAAPAAAKPRVEIIDFGLYSTRHVRTEPAPDQIARQREVVADIKLQKKTRKFIAVLGRTFGYRYRVNDKSLDGKLLTFRIIFPKPSLHNPSTGQSRAWQDTKERVQAGTVGFEGYGFDHRWELAEGIWIMQIRYKGELLAEQKFHVLVPLN